MRRIWVALALVVALLLSCTGCAPSNAQPKVEDPPYYEAVYTNLGQNLDTVVAAMGLSTEDFTTWMFPWNWCYKESVSYQGYDFMMVLEAHNDRVTAVKYVLYCDNAPEEAAAIAVDLREKLTGHGEPYDFGLDKEQPLKTVTKEALIERFSDPEGSAALGLTWILTTDLSHVPQDTTASRQPTCISLTYDVAYPDESGKADGVESRVVISLTYGLSYSYVAD